jgi:DNA-binding CsgD family transcriptional regulator
MTLAASRNGNGTHGLSESEMETLRLTATGLPTDEIAAQMDTSPQVVKNHWQSIYGKLGCRRNRVAAVLLAIRKGIVK